MNKNKFLYISFAVLAVVFVIVIVAGAVSKNSSNDDSVTDKVSAETAVTTIQTTSAENTAPDTTALHTSEITASTEGVTSPSVPEENDEQFEEIIGKAGYSTEDFSFNQLITVESSGATAQLNTFEKIDGVWVKTPVLDDVFGYVGSWGVSKDANEYANYTPAGLFSLGTAFGICDDPGTKLDYFKVTEESYWVDDANSDYYNQHIEGTEQKDWESAEHLIEYEGYYDYCVFIEYNTNPVVAGKGSAFFLHVGNEATAGCVAISESDMINTLCWLSKEENPHILIY